MKITKEGYAIIENDTHIGKWVEQNKRLDFDQNAIPLIINHIKKGDVVVDCGANIGAYSYAFLQEVGDTGGVVCFESNPETFECLKYNLGHNSNAVLLNFAVGDKSGRVSVVSNQNAGASYCVFSHDGEIEMRTIDSLNLLKCDFIKIDVEGWELSVLQGAIKTIQNFHPKLYIEINEGTLKRNGVNPDEIFQFLDIFGYTYRNIYTNEPMSGEQFDIICI